MGFLHFDKRNEIEGRHFSEFIITDTSRVLSILQFSENNFFPNGFFNNINCSLHHMIFYISGSKHTVII